MTLDCSGYGYCVVGGDGGSSDEGGGGCVGVIVVVVVIVCWSQRTYCVHWYVMVVSLCEDNK